MRFREEGRTPLFSMNHRYAIWIVSILALCNPCAHSGPLEDALDGGAGTYTTAGTGSWGSTGFPTHDGVDAAVSPQINVGQSTEIQVTVDGPGIMSFWWKVESEISAGQTFTALSPADGVAIGPFTGYQPNSIIVFHPSSLVRWVYDQTVSPGSSFQNRGWLDEVYYFPQPKKVAGGIGSGDQFGSRTKVAGNLAAVSSKDGVDLYHLFDLSNPTERGRFSLPGDPSGIDLEGLLLAVGAPLDGDSLVASGAVYLVDCSDPDNPLQLTKLKAPTPTAYAGFGYGVSICGNLLLVGAPTSTTQVDLPGECFLYDISDPTAPEFLASFQGSDAAADNFFGDTVELNGSRAAIYGKQLSPSTMTHVYLFDVSDPSNPVEKFKFSPPGDDSLGFGAGALSIHGNLLAIGDQLAADMGNFAGAADLYDISDLASPVLQKRITASDGEANAFFGTRTEISGNYLLVGAYGDDSQRGAAYVYDITTPTAPVRRAKLVAHDQAAGDFYGFAASIFGNRMAIGALGDGVNTGATYFPYMPWVGEHYELCPTTPEIPYTGKDYPLPLNATGLWNASSDSTWATIDTTFGFGNDSIGVTVSTNRSTLPRTAKISVGDAEHIITQAGAPGGPRINAPKKLNVRNRGRIKTSISSELGVSLKAKATGGAKAKVRGRNPYKVIVSKLKRKVTRVKLTATDEFGRSSRKTVKLKKK